jgi:hypothetical protein
MPSGDGPTIRRQKIRRDEETMSKTTPPQTASSPVLRRHVLTAGAAAGLAGLGMSDVRPARAEETMHPQRAEHFDVVVVGGGSSGVAAAVSAARLGARTALFERYGFLGGAATNALVQTYCGFFYSRHQPEWAVGGIGKEYLDGLAKYTGKVDPLPSSSGNWVIPFDAESAKVALDELVIGAKVTTRLHSWLVDVRRDGDRIMAVRLADHAGIYEVAAPVFVDATGEGDLAFQAKVPMAFVGERRQVGSFCARIGGIPADVKLSAAQLTPIAAAAQPPAGAPARIRENGGVLMHIPGTDDLWWMGIDVVNDGLFSATMTETAQVCRATAWAFIRGLRALPGCERATLVATGPQVGIRESRHPLARHMLNENEVVEGRGSDTIVARGAWYVERHNALGAAQIVNIGGPGYFGIPADALRAAQVRNLWLAGRITGADPVATASLRVMGTGFATGQAAGTAAALALKGKTDYATLRTALLDHGAIL